jgi:DNA-binding helix-hairpin-helix protein with protein kinase domain
VPTLLPEKVRIPWSFLQKSVGWVGIGALALLVLAACGGAKPLIIIAALCCAVFGGWWCALECARLMSQKRENADWEDAWHRVQYEKAQRREQVAAWQHAVQQELDRREQVSRAAQTALNQAEGHWQQEAARYSATFSNLRMRFAELKRQYEGLTHEYSQEYRQLQQNVRMAQLNQFLQTRFISDHSITDIGPVRKAALLSYGIESAFDVESGAVSQIPGFGVKLTKKLIEWRGEMEQAFRFDPTAGIPQSEITALDSKYRRKKQDIETELAKGPETLRIQSQQAENHLSQLAVGIQRFVLQAAQGDANAAILRGLQS